MTTKKTSDTMKVVFRGDANVLIIPGEYVEGEEDFSMERDGEPVVLPRTTIDELIHQGYRFDEVLGDSTTTPIEPSAEAEEVTTQEVVTNG